MTITRPFVQLLSLAAVLVSAPVASATGIIMPIYGNTSSQFNAAISAAGKVRLIAVISPDSGPGSSKVSGITTPVSKLKSNGAIAAGYVSTRYGAVSASSVKSQIDKYASWYKCNGIFLDEMSDRSNKVSYYQGIYNYARGKGLRVVGNPGTSVPSSYASVADHLVTYEDPYSAGWNTHKPASWTKGYSADKFAAIIISAPSSSMRNIVDRAISLRYGWVFATDTNTNFQKAPGYISAEADYIRQKNGGKK